MRRPTIIRLSKNGAPMRTLNRKLLGSGLGAGNASFLLDGGVGGQNSYSSIEDYENTTGVNIKQPRGKGLIDKIGDRLGKINIDKSMPKKKNITMNF